MVVMMPGEHESCAAVMEATAGEGAHASAMKYRAGAATVENRAAVKSTAAMETTTAAAVKTSAAASVSTPTTAHLGDLRVRGDFRNRRRCRINR